MIAFTSREKNIIQLIVEEGLSNKDIAYKFGITEGTVKQTLKNVFNKLHINSRDALIIRYYKAVLEAENITANFSKSIALVI